MERSLIILDIDAIENLRVGQVLRMFRFNRFIFEVSLEHVIVTLVIDI